MVFALCLLCSFHLHTCSRIRKKKYVVGKHQVTFVNSLTNGFFAGFAFQTPFCKMPLESSLLLKLGWSDCIWLCVFADGFLHQYHTAENESPLYALTAKHTRELWLKVRIRWKKGQWITIIAHFLWQSWVDFQLARVFDSAWEIWELFLLGMLGISFISLHLGM